MTLPGIEPKSAGPLTNTLPTSPEQINRSFISYNCTYYVCLSMAVFVCVCVCVCVRLSVCVYDYVCAYMSVLMCMCVYFCVCKYFSVCVCIMILPYTSVLIVPVCET